MAADTPTGSTSVAEEAARLKAALRERMPAPTDDPVPGGGRPGPGPADPERAEPDCPLCRVNRFAHDLAEALTPDLIEQVGRGLGTLGRTLTDCADALRRHTPDRSETTDHAEPPAAQAGPHPHEEPA
ncbi:hypothetical protein [Arsenicicoccus dermatophilus]|uniref:hypothetical protein n=1 Tax=Arsenicicoccus dermatophilus TaxID=1076331 RepID=UPI001F4CAFC7|nr:hypothetical protein [Arsenicicoccus dermatophilus]MCH8612660.1 hypothetical protein [Arsenicicoccus dermatophilus]